MTTSRGPATATEALRRIDGDGVTLVGMTLREPSLDDVFLTLTGHRAEDEAVTAAPVGRRA